MLLQHNVTSHFLLHLCAYPLNSVSVLALITHTYFIIQIVHKYFAVAVYGRLSLGAEHTLILERDGTVWATGHNLYGQLGMDPRDHSTVRTFREVVIDSAKAVAAGGGHSMVLKQDGSVWSTGRNEFGQLGNGLKNGCKSFTLVISGHATAIAAGTKHSLVVMEDGGVWAAGVNQYGQLGDGSTYQRNTFVQVISGGAAVAAAGKDHSMVLKHDGSVWTAGFNGYGQLGADPQLMSAFSCR